MALVSGRYRAVKMQFFCLKLHLMIGLQECAGLRVSGLSGSLAVGGNTLAGVAEANGVSPEKNLLSLTCELLLGSATLSDNFPLMLASFIM